MSMYNGVKAAEKCFGLDDNIVLVHDGVKLLITADEISKNIASVKQNGSVITCVKTKETCVLVDDERNVCDVSSRVHSYVAKAPQSFYLRDILAAGKKAISEGKSDVIDSCMLMCMYGHKLSVVEGSYKNIKITTPEDFFMFRALYDARENLQLG